VLIPFLYATSPRTRSLRSVRVSSDQNTRWQLPFHFLPINDKNFLSSHICQIDLHFRFKVGYIFSPRRRPRVTKLLVEMKRWFSDITLNVILKIIVSKRYVDYVSRGEEKPSHEWGDSIRTFLELAGMFVVSDALPFLRWLDLGGVEKAMKRTSKNIDRAVEKWLEEHKQKKASGTAKGEEDFMDLMLSVLDDGKELSNRSADTINKATCLVRYFSTNLWYNINGHI